jgi:hypothetical protein
VHPGFFHGPAVRLNPGTLRPATCRIISHYDNKNTDFNALHSRKHDHEVQLYAFDILALDGEDDLRALPLSMRKTSRVSSWVRRRPVFDSRIPSATCRRRFARNAPLGYPLKPFQ